MSATMMQPRQQAGVNFPDGGIPAYGTLIQVATGQAAPNDWVTIEGVGDITGPGNSMAEIDVTSHSTGVPIKQTIPGLIDLGSLAFPCYWIPGEPTQASDSPYGLEYLFFNRIRTMFQLVEPDPTHYTRQFKGFIMTLGEDSKVAGVMTRNVSIRITTPFVVVPSAIALTPVNNLTVPNAGTATDATFAVAAGGSNAPWIAVPSDPWITITTPVGQQQGDGVVTYGVAAGTAGTARSGSISITGLGLSFPITQLDA